MLGPEAPLIAIGGGLVVLALRAARRNLPEKGVAELASAGSFAAISTLFGSPILGAFLLMEASGLGGPMMGVVLVPGLLAAGIGSLVFIGLNAWTGLGTFSLAIPGLPHFGEPTIGEFGWALVIGIAAALLGSGIRWLGLRLQPYSVRRPPLAAVAAGLIVAGPGDRLCRRHREGLVRSPVLRAERARAADHQQRLLQRPAPWRCCSPARRWPTACR